MHPFVIDAKGSMYVDVATATNSCQVKNRTLKSPGVDPCTELETRGGIWLYDAEKTNQIFSPAQRFATGIRNAEGFAIDATGRLLVTQHGRDQLHANWPDLFQPDQEATLPAEELLLLKQGGDYGWPECYYDQFVQKLVLAQSTVGTAGKRSAFAPTRSLRSQHFLRTGRRMRWPTTIKNSSQSTIAAATMSFINLSPATKHLARVRFSRMVSREP